MRASGLVVVVAVVVAVVVVVVVVDDVDVVGAGVNGGVSSELNCTSSERGSCISRDGVFVTQDTPSTSVIAAHSLAHTQHRLLYCCTLLI